MALLLATCQARAAPTPTMIHPSSADGQTGGRASLFACRGEAGRGGRALCRRLRGHLTCRAPPRKTLFNCSSLPVSCCCCLPSNLDKRCSCTHGPGHGPKWMEASACHACRSISLEHLALLYCILLLFIHGVVCILRRIYHRKEFENAEQ